MKKEFIVYRFDSKEEFDLLIESFGKKQFKTVPVYPSYSRGGFLYDASVELSAGWTSHSVQEFKDFVKKECGDEVNLEIIYAKDLIKQKKQNGH